MEIIGNIITIYTSILFLIGITAFLIYVIIKMYNDIKLEKEKNENKK